MNFILRIGLGPRLEQGLWLWLVLELKLWLIQVEIRTRVKVRLRLGPTAWLMITAIKS